MTDLMWPPGCMSGNSPLGRTLVIGIKRVPLPAIGITTFRIIRGSTSRLRLAWLADLYNLAFDLKEIEHFEDRKH